MRHMQNQIQNLKKAVEKQEKPGSTYKAASDLEQLFLDCISEVKRDVLRRRSEAVVGRSGISRGASAAASKSGGMGSQTLS